MGSPQLSLPLPLLSTPHCSPPPSPSTLSLYPLQGSEETRLRHQHISTLVVSLAEFVQMADRKIIANTLSQLKLELDFDSSAISQLQVVLFGFQDAVSAPCLQLVLCLFPSIISPIMYEINL